MNFNPQKIAAYLTLASAVLGFSEQVRRNYVQCKVFVEKRKKQKEGFGFLPPKM